MSRVASAEPRPRLGPFVFVHYNPAASGPAIRRLTTGEATARLYANALNPLAHADDGLDGAVRITAACHYYELVSADLSATSALLAQNYEYRQNQRAMSGE
jgi:hypothetical protein